MSAQRELNRSAAQRRLARLLAPGGQCHTNLSIDPLADKIFQKLERDRAATVDEQPPEGAARCLKLPS